MLGTRHRSLPSHTSKGQARTDLQLSELRFSSNWDPPAPHLMVNAYGVACACSFCAQMLPVSTAIQRSLSDKLKPYVSCLSPASIHSYSDRVHGLSAPVAAHKAGEARPSGSLLSGGSREQQSKCPAHTAIPRHPLMQRQCYSLPCVASQHHWQYHGKSKEDQSRGWTANRSSDLPSPPPPRQSAQGGERVFGQKKCTSSKSLPSLQPAYTGLKSHQTSQTTQVCNESC